MRLLEIVRADLGRGNLRCYRHHRNARALAVEQAVDKVQVAGAATSGADREAAGNVGVGAGGEGGDLLVPHVQPFDPAAPRMASVKPFKLSPTTLKTRFTPAVARTRPSDRRRFGPSCAPSIDGRRFHNDRRNPAAKD